VETPREEDFRGPLTLGEVEKIDPGRSRELLIKTLFDGIGDARIEGNFA
jgi:hypothetical protein